MLQEMLWVLKNSVSDPSHFDGSGSSDQHWKKLDPDPGPKRIRIRVPIFHIFHK